MENYLEKHYSVLGAAFSLCSNCPDWMVSMDNFLSITENTRPVESGLKLHLIEAGADCVDDFICLPHQNCCDENVLLLNMPVPFTVYVEGPRRWNDYVGFGRSVIDYGSGWAKAVRCRGSGFEAGFSDIVLGYNLLVHLMIRTGFYVIHASCVELGGKGIVITGNSGKGKSTAAYSMARRGHPILADDRLLLVKQGGYRGIGVTDVVKIRPEAVNLFFPELHSQIPLYELCGEKYFKASSVDCLNYSGMTKVEFVFILERTGEPKSRLERIHPSRVVGDLFPVTINPYEHFNMAERFNFLMDFLHEVKCYRVYFGTDMDYFAGTIEELVGG